MICHFLIPNVHSDPFVCYQNYELQGWVHLKTLLIIIFVQHETSSIWLSTWSNWQCQWTLDIQNLREAHWHTGATTNNQIGNVSGHWTFRTCTLHWCYYKYLPRIEISSTTLLAQDNDRQTPLLGFHGEVILVTIAAPEELWYHSITNEIGKV